MSDLISLKNSWYLKIFVEKLRNIYNNILNNLNLFCSFGKRTGGSARRPNECFVLEPSEMIVVSSFFALWNNKARGKPRRRFAFNLFSKKKENAGTLYLLKFYERASCGRLCFADSFNQKQIWRKEYNFFLQSVRRGMQNCICSETFSEYYALANYGVSGDIAQKDNARETCNVVDS